MYSIFRTQFNMNKPSHQPAPKLQELRFGTAVGSLLVAAGLSSILIACGGAGDVEQEQQDAAAEVQSEVDVNASEVDVDAEDDGRATAAAVVAVSDKPVGFAAGVTGGGGRSVVRVTTAAQLKHELCHSPSAKGDICNDHEPRTIEVSGMIDFTNSEGTASADGCFASALCTAPGAKNEVTLIITESERPRCDNKPGRGKYSYSVAGVQGLTIGSNKTVVGIGKNSGLKGKGVMLKNNVSNIIIRNLSFTDINAGKVFGADAITIKDATRVWIDHNYFARIGRQMIVTGTGSGLDAVDDLTISNNEFDGRSEYACDGRHYWNVLLVGNGQMTFSGNWFHHFAGRAPKFNSGKGLQVHLVNNYFDNAGTHGHALEYSERVQVLAEGNYFNSVGYPVDKPPAKPGQLYGIYSQNAASKASCTNAIGRICSGNIVTPPPTANHMVQDSAALNAMKPLKASLVKSYSATNVPDTVRAKAGVGKVAALNR